MYLVNVPVNSERIPAGDTPLVYVQPWARYAVMTGSSLVSIDSIPTAHASCNERERQREREREKRERVIYSIVHVHIVPTYY